MQRDREKMRERERERMRGRWCENKGERTKNKREGGEIGRKCNLPVCTRTNSCIKHTYLGVPAKDPSRRGRWSRVFLSL